MATFEADHLFDPILMHCHINFKTDEDVFSVFFANFETLYGQRRFAAAQGVGSVFQQRCRILAPRRADGNVRCAVSGCVVHGVPAARIGQPSGKNRLESNCFDWPSRQFGRPGFLLR
jgi:hypothetical protein